MNETIPFTQSWAFYVIICFVSFMLGFFVAALLASSGQASRDEERIEFELSKDGKTGTFTPITKGTSDRE